MYYFDLHTHPASKSFLTDERESKRKGPWKKIRGGLLQPLAPFLKSQSNFTQLHEGGVKISVFSIVPVEKGFSNYWLIRDIAGIFLVLDKSFIRDINYQVYTYADLFWNELSHIKKNLSYRRRKVKLLKSIEGFDQNRAVIHGLISIEGSHALKGKQGSDAEYLENLNKVKNARDFSALYMTMTHLTWKSDMQPCLWGQDHQE